MQMNLLFISEDQNFLEEKKKSWKEESIGDLSDQTFENFLVSPSNNSTINIIKTICQKPGIDFPLVYLVGKAGMGKTHLIHAAFKELSKSMKVHYSSGRDFLEFYQERCERQGHFRTLKDFNNSFDVLILDDIDEVYPSKDFQDYFCHLYNHFSYGKKQIILSGFANQKELMGTSPKFYSRLTTALVLEINPMDYQLANSYLEMVSKGQKVELSLEVKKEILDNSIKDGRSLKGAITNYKASGFLAKKNKDLLQEEVPVEDQIIRSISQYFNYKEEDILSPSRKRELILPRHICMYLMYRMLNFNFLEIGKKFNRDHSSIIYAVSKIEEKKMKDKKILDQINSIIGLISTKDKKILYH